MIFGSVDSTLAKWRVGGSRDVSPRKRTNILFAGPCFLLRLSPLFLFYTDHVYEISRNLRCLANPLGF